MINYQHISYYARKTYNVTWENDSGINSGSVSHGSTVDDKVDGACKKNTTILGVYVVQFCGVISMENNSLFSLLARVCS